MYCRDWLCESGTEKYHGPKEDFIVAIDMSAGTKVIFAVAALEAAAGRCRELGSEHVFLAMCKICDLDKDEVSRIAEATQVSLAEMQAEADNLGSLLSEAHVDLVEARRRLRKLLEKQQGIEGEFGGHRSEACLRVCHAAERRALVLGDVALSPAHLLWAVVSSGCPLVRQAVGESTGGWSDLCHVCGVEPSVPLAQSGSPEELRHARAGVQDVENASGGKVEAGKGASKTPFLDRFGRDLTQLAREDKLGPCVGRKDEMRSVAHILRRRSKNNPVLVGDPGVGKTCIVEGLARRVVHPEAPEAIRSWRIVEISMSELIAGCMYQGQFEERMQTVISEARTDRNLVLFLDELHTMIGTGGASGKGMDAGQILKPALARGDIRLIGATTTAEYRKFIEPDGALERRFQVVWVSEPSRAEAVEILEGIRPKLEKHHGVVLDLEVIEKTVEWSMRYLPDHRLPDKAIDIIDQAAAKKALRTLSPQELKSDRTMDIYGDRGERITEQDIAAVISERCQVPVGAIAVDESAKLMGMEVALASRVKGQDEAIKVVSSAIRTARAGLKKANRPVGVFLFLGSTGTGKTELAKTLAEFLFGSEETLIRFDMSEFGEKHNVARLVGAPPGYIGHDEEGQLTGRVRTRPYSVILFDEIEKAHTDVFDIFLQIFDDGRLTDGKGRRTSFTESIIIMTSNLGAASAHGQAKRPIGVDLASSGAEEGDGERAAYRKRLCDAAKSVFRPELLNRIEHQVIFYPLPREIVFQILDRMIGLLNQMLADRRITVQLSEEAKKLLLDEGYSEAYGARELERVFERRVAAPLAEQLLAGRFSPGNEIRIDVCEGGLRFG